METRVVLEIVLSKCSLKLCSIATLISILEGIVQKISYDYESVDENSLSYAMSRKNDEKNNSDSKGL